MMKIALLALLPALASTQGALADFHGLLAHARTGNLEGVRALLAEGADPNPPHDRYDGYTPLMFSAGNGDPEMTRLLLEAGARTEQRDHNGERALQWAARQSFLNPFRDNAECARLLLAAGSPADSADDRYGSSPLIEVSRYGSDAAMVRHLLAAGADPDRAASGLTPVLAAITGRYATDGSHADAARRLAERTADIDRAFAAALWHDMPEVAGQLHRRGADIDAVDHRGRSAFAAAAAVLPDSAWLDRLVEAGADIARHGGEALRETAARGRDDRLARLVGLGVAISGTPLGASALVVAAGAGRVSTVDLLLERGARLDAAEGMDRAARDGMESARAVLEAAIARAEGSRAYIDVSAERAELARLEAAHARIVEMLRL